MTVFLFRWIIYNPKDGVDYDASMVPAEWFGWLHYKTDKTPLEKVLNIMMVFMLKLLLLRPLSNIAGSQIILQILLVELLVKPLLT